MKLTEEQKRRTQQSLDQTRALICKEREYMVELQDKDYIATLEEHAGKLEKMLLPDYEFQVFLS